MDLFASWIILGTVVGVILYFVDLGGTKQPFFSSILWGILGAITGGVFAHYALSVELSDIHLSPLIVVLIGSSFIAAIPKKKKGDTNFPK